MLYPIDNLLYVVLGVILLFHSCKMFVSSEKLRYVFSMYMHTLALDAVFTWSSIIKDGS